MNEAVIKLLLKAGLVAALAVPVAVNANGNSYNSTGGSPAPSGHSTSTSSAYCTFGAKYQRSITENGNRAVATFFIPEHCGNREYSLVSYKAPNSTGRPFSAQRLYSSSTAIFGPGTHTISVAIPDCYHQVDLIKGQPVANLSDEGTYAPAGRLITSMIGGNKSCAATVTTAAATPTPAPAQPTQLPQAGPEAAAGSAAGLGLVGYTSWYYLRSRRSLKDSLLNK